MTVIALVPAYRRADRVGATVAALAPLVDEVVVVDDGSDDGGATIDAARQAGARVVALPANRGKGGAVAEGVAATPEATTYLLVDADTAASAAATAPLLAAVASGADLAIGILPPAGGQGGLGNVRRLARWGIRRACGFEAAAPLSGQRAARAELLRSLGPADRFGLEAAMTIDAIRAGAVVVEVPVEVDHAHTGRDVAGFVHRGAQGYDLVRALWPRLLGEKARLVLLIGGAVALVAVLAATSAARVPAGTPLAAVDQVILVAAPATLALADLDDPSRPELAALAGRRGAVAAANVDVADSSPWSTWATVGAGAKVRARPPTRPVDPSEPFLVQDRVEGAGRLGDALATAGRTTAFVGSDVLSPVRLAVADGTGRIGRAASAGSLGVSGLANRTRADVSAGASLVAVDAGTLDAAGFEDLLGRLREVDPGRTLLLLVTPAAPDVPLRLRPLVASGPGAPAGLLLSPSTRRAGLVLLSDVAPTVLDVLGVPIPGEMIGRPLERLAGPGGLGQLVRDDRLARQRETVWDPALVAVGFLHAGALGWAWQRRRRGGRPLGAGETGPRVGSRGLTWAALALSAWPLATWLTRAAPGTGSLGRGAGLVALAFDLIVVAAAWSLSRRRGLAPLGLVVGATVAFITVDLGLGGSLQVSSAFGGATHSTGRFTGLGNVAFAVYAASVLVAVACGRRRAPWMVALLVVVALVDALPSLGADVGGAGTLGPVFILTAAALWGRLRLRTVALAVVATSALLGLALALDLSRPDDQRTHLARFVAGGGQSSSIGGKLGQNLGTYAVSPLLVPVVLVAAGFALLLWRGRFQAALAPGSPARIGVAAILAVSLVGNALNDSGAIVTGVALLVLAPYLVARVAATERPPRHLPPLAGDPDLAGRVPATTPAAGPD